MRLFSKVAVLAAVACTLPFTLPAQSVSPAPAVIAETLVPPPAASTPAGPTIASSSVAVRPAVDSVAVTAQRGTRSQGFGQSQALMIVGGAAVVVGIIIGGESGTLIAVGGAVVGLYGLYQYLK